MTKLVFLSLEQVFNEVLTDGQDFKKPFLKWNPGNLYSSDKLVLWVR